MKKLNFTFKNADKKTRIIGIVALALALISILIVVLSANSAINGSFTKIPLIKLAASEGDLEKINDGAEEIVDGIEEAIENDDDEILDKLREEYGMSPKKLLDKFDPVSLNSIKIVMDKSESNEYGEYVPIFSAIITGITVYAAILAIFVALSALFMNKGFFITSVVLSALFFLALVNFVWFFVFLALCIAYCILVSKVKKAYKLYNEAPAAVECECQQS